jgi:hypothetical protein
MTKAKPIISAEELKQALMQDDDFLKPLVQLVVQGLREGRWRTGPQFAAWMEQAHDIELCHTQTYYWLKKAGATLKVPR